MFVLIFDKYLATPTIFPTFKNKGFWVLLVGSIDWRACFHHQISTNKSCQWYSYLTFKWFILVQNFSYLYLQSCTTGAAFAAVDDVAFAASAAFLILIIIRKSWSFCRGLFSSSYQVVGQLATELFLAFTYIYRPCWPIRSQYLSRMANQKLPLSMEKCWPFIGQPIYKRVSSIRSVPQFM